MINCAVWAYRGTNIAFSYDKAWWAHREPLLFTNLAIVTSLLLSVSAPEGKWFFTASFSFFEEFGAREVSKLSLLSLLNYWLLLFAVVKLLGSFKAL